MIKSTISTSDVKSPEHDKLMHQFELARMSFVSIGLHDDAGEYTDAQGQPTGVSVVEVGLWNEFGTDTSPERSFIRSTVDENFELINQWREKALDDVVAGRKTVEDALSAVGFKVQVLIQNKIKSGVPPPNAPSTIAQKERDGVAPRTLQDTQLMLRSVTFKVRMRGQ